MLPEKEPPPLLVLVGDTFEATSLATDLRSSGVPVLHLAENLASEAAARYASSVDASWICYPAPGGVKLARVGPGGDEYALVAVEDVAGRVLP